MLHEIITELEKSGYQRTPIPLSQVQTWMKTEDIDALGAVYGFLSNADQVQRVVPSLSFDDVFNFMLRYYDICLRTDPESRWANSRYSAGWDLAGWFVQMWDQKRDKKYFVAIKSMLEKLYLTGSPELRKAIEHAIVEHLFERKAIRQFFSDWRDNPQLGPAFEEGKLWVDEGGKSPLTEPLQRKRRSG